ncbi:MAG TPA: hypothetical protein VGJ44_27280, partial [Kribbellaceae bacterium]
GHRYGRYIDDAAFVSVPDFNLQLNIAKTVITEVGGNSLAEQQARLRELVPRMAEDEREWATRMIDKLPRITTPPPPPSPQMLEALEIQHAASTTRGTRDEQRAVLEAARKKIWEIADGVADERDSANIAGLTRTLDHLQESLDDPFWEDSLPPADGDQMR